MDFKQYEYVLMVAKERNFSKAAKKLFISQPSLSQYISRIESDLGVTLFNRNSTPLKLTTEGKIYVETAKKIMSLSKEMLRAFDDVKELKKGKLKLGLTPSKANHPLPSILPLFNSRYPHIEVSITEASSLELEMLLLDGHIDLAIMNLPLKENAITYEPIIAEKIYIAAPKNFDSLPENELDAIDLTSIGNKPFILLNAGLRLREIADHVFLTAGIKPNILIETRSIETSIRLSGAGLGFTFVPESTALFSGIKNLPKYYLLGDPPLSWTMAIAYKKESYIPKTAYAFIAVMKEVMKELYGELL